MSSYNQNIPQSYQYQDNSQAQILSNFGSLDSTFGLEHTLFSDTTPHLGQHKQVTLFQNLATVPTLTSPASILYSQNKGSGSTLSTNLYYSTLVNTVQAYLQMTNLPIVSVADGNPGSAGGTMNYIDTPWNLRIYFGKTAGLTTGHYLVTFSPAAYTTIILANGWASTAGGNVTVTGLEGAASLNIGITSSSSIAVNWFSMGRIGL